MNQTKNKKLKKSLEIIAFLLLVGLPLAFAIYIYNIDSDMNSSKNSKKSAIIQHYHVSNKFEKAEIIDIVSKMKKDKEFEFYFFALDDLQIGKATEYVINFLSKNKDNRSIFKEMERLSDEIRNAGIMFYYMDIPPDFKTDPSKYKEINNLMWSFLTEELKLTILGVCYKVVYNNDFRYSWDTQSVLAAQKLKNLVSDLKNMSNTSTP